MVFRGEGKVKMRANRRRCGSCADREFLFRRRSLTQEEEEYREAVAELDYAKRKGHAQKQNRKCRA